MKKIVYIMVFSILLSFSLIAKTKATEIYVGDHITSSSERVSKRYIAQISAIIIKEEEIQEVVITRLKEIGDSSATFSLKKGESIILNTTHPTRQRNLYDTAIHKITIIDIKGAKVSLEVVEVIL